MLLRVLLLSIVMMPLGILKANATLVTPENSVTFFFDVSALGDVTATRYSWCNDFSLSCASSSGEPTLADGASMRINFGLTPGADDLGTLLITNPIGGPIGNLSGPFGPFPIDGGLDIFFATFIYVDDIYGADGLTLLNFDTDLEIDGVELTTEVPLPAALPLFLVGVAGLYGAARRRLS